MSSTITVSNDVERISDSILLRQLADVPREQVKTLVQMVLDFAEEAATKAAVAHQFYEVLTMVENLDGRVRAIFTSQQAGQPSREFHVDTPLLSTEEGTAIAERLSDLVGRRVLVSVRIEDAGPGWIRHVISDVEAAG